MKNFIRRIFQLCGCFCQSAAGLENPHNSDADYFSDCSDVASIGGVEFFGVGDISPANYGRDAALLDVGSTLANGVLTGDEMCLLVEGGRLNLDALFQEASAVFRMTKLGDEGYQVTEAFKSKHRCSTLGELYGRFSLLYDIVEKAGCKVTIDDNQTLTMQKG